MILYTIGPNVNIDNVVIDKDEKKYSSLPTKCGAGIPGPDVSKVIYEEVTNVRIHTLLSLCNYDLLLL